MNRIKGLSKDIQQLIIRAEKAGCRVSPTTSMHIKLMTPQGGMVVIPKTGGRGRGLMNATAELRRAGVKI